MFLRYNRKQEQRQEMMERLIQGQITVNSPSECYSLNNNGQCAHGRAFSWLLHKAVVLYHVAFLIFRFGSGAELLESPEVP